MTAISAATAMAAAIPMVAALATGAAFLDGQLSSVISHPVIWHSGQGGVLAYLYPQHGVNGVKQQAITNPAEAANSHSFPVSHLPSVTSFQ